MPVALHFGQPDAEAAAVKTLALCDMSGLPKLGLKGTSAADWLAGQSVDVPETVYDTRRLPDDGVCVRLPDDELMLESGITARTVPALSGAFVSAEPGVVRVERQEATFLLTGARAIEVLAQTCGVDFRDVPDDRAILTRVAMVSCTILPESTGDVKRYRLWLEYGYAVGLWDILATIARELGGSVVGARAVYPDSRDAFG